MTLGHFLEASFVCFINPRKKVCFATPFLLILRARKRKNKNKTSSPRLGGRGTIFLKFPLFTQCAPALWEVHWLCYDSCHHCAEGKLDNPLTEVVRMSLQISGLKYLTEFFSNNTKEMNSRIWEIESTKRKMLFFSCLMSSMWKSIFYLVSSS